MSVDRVPEAMVADALLIEDGKLFRKLAAVEPYIEIGLNLMYRSVRPTDEIPTRFIASKHIGDRTFDSFGEAVEWILE